MVTNQMTAQERAVALLGALDTVLELSAGIVYHRHPEDVETDSMYGRPDPGWLMPAPDPDEDTDEYDRAFALCVDFQAMQERAAAAASHLRQHLGQDDGATRRVDRPMLPMMPMGVEAEVEEGIHSAAPAADGGLAPRCGATDPHLSITTERASMVTCGECLRRMKE